MISKALLRDRESRDPLKAVDTSGEVILTSARQSHLAPCFQDSQLQPLTSLRLHWQMGPIILPSQVAGKIR